ncbi:hypothetical protein [uncultured Sphingomonas sp.]|uniref:hypothetical protein n=1 Tax=uncultured Sphingomonas sp. TaxID=158754 RepID=UPI0025939694|nr:hypothetical protein [uncultured Sphingomonas sp.]
MIKPPSIARFEQLYWGSVVIGWINTAVNWRTQQALREANPLLANATWLMPTALVVNLLITLTIWYFIVRRASVVAKWFQVVFAAFSVLGLISIIFQFAMGRAPSVVFALLGVATAGLYIAAATMLFRPDAKEWFGEGRDIEEDAPLV